MDREFDASDRKILVALHENARISMSSLAKRARVSREVAAYRVSRLVQNGFIRAFIARVNVSHLCDGVASVFFKLVRGEESRFERIVEYLKQHACVNWMAELCGTYDLVITIMYRSPEHLGDTIAEITQVMGKTLKEHHLALYIAEYKLSRRGLFSGEGERKPPEVIRFRGITEVLLDGKDLKILERLAADCRSKNIDLSRVVKLGEDAVRIRIRRMESLGIILGYTIVPNLALCGFEGYYLGMQVEQLTEQNVSKIKEYAYQNPYIIYCARASGRYNLIISIYAHNRAHFTELLLDIRRNFGPLLVDYEFQLSLQEYKETFIPKGFFVHK